MVQKSKASVVDSNLIRLKPSHLSHAIILVNALNKGIKDNHKKLSAFIWGSPGIGKSQIIEQVAEEYGYHLVDLRLSQMSELDVRGMPYINTETKSADWYCPDFMRDIGKKKIIFCDEINTAPPLVQSAAYQLILNRKIGQFELHDDDIIIAAGNNQKDKGATFILAKPLCNRFVHFDLVHDYEDFKNYAIRADFHPATIGFLEKNQDHLFTFDPASSDKAFATPRTWEFVSTIEKNYTKDIPKHVLNAAIVGSIGNATGSLYWAFRTKYEFLPDPKDIFDGRIKTFNEHFRNLKVDNKEKITLNEDQGLKYATITNLLQLLYKFDIQLRSDKQNLKSHTGDSKKTRLTKEASDKWHEKFYNVLSFVANPENAEKEYSIYFLKQSLKNFQFEIDEQHPCIIDIWSTILEEFQSIMVRV